MTSVFYGTQHISQEMANNARGRCKENKEIAQILDISDAFCILRTTDVKAK
jgi:hypothetical protein